jgi:heterodisulfide reductase subunit B
MDAPARPLPTLLPLVEDLVSVLIARDYKSAELTALLLWLNSHCNSCGRVLTNANHAERATPLCVECTCL